MARARRVLFACEGNRHRSPTAERLDAKTPGVRARSAGLSPLARVQVTDDLLAWADVVFVMERRLRGLLRRRFAAALAGKELVCLGVPDDFQAGQPELVAVLSFTVRLKRSVVVGEAPAEPLRPRLGRSLALQHKRTPATGPCISPTYASASSRGVSSAATAASTPAARMARANSRCSVLTIL